MKKHDEYELFIRNKIIYFHCKKAAERYAKDNNGEVVIHDFNTIRYYGVKGVLERDEG